MSKKIATYEYIKKNGDGRGGSVNLKTGQTIDDKKKRCVSQSGCMEVFDNVTPRLTVGDTTNRNRLLNIKSYIVGSGEVTIISKNFYLQFEPPARNVEKIKVSGLRYSINNGTSIPIPEFDLEVANKYLISTSNLKVGDKITLDYSNTTIKDISQTITLSIEVNVSESETVLTWSGNSSDDVFDIKLKRYGDGDGVIDNGISLQITLNYEGNDSITDKFNYSFGYGFQPPLPISVDGIKDSDIPINTRKIHNISEGKATANTEYTLKLTSQYVQGNQNNYITSTVNGRTRIWNWKWQMGKNSGNSIDSLPECTFTTNSNGGSMINLYITLTTYQWVN